MRRHRRPSRALIIVLGVASFALCVAAGAQALTDDPGAIWTLQGENASLSTGKVTDRFYTNGVRLGWISPIGGGPAALQNLGHGLLGDVQQRFSMDVSQQIYTPIATRLRLPVPTDRPYAGVLMANFGLLADTANRRTQLGLGVGVIGPSALGMQTQNGFHGVIGQGSNLGWARQIGNEPLLQFTASRTWRLPLGTIGGLEIDALPNLSVGVGNLRLYGQGGVTMRLGRGLNADFGVARLLPGLSGGDAYLPTDFAWYVFFGANGQAVGRDITLDGNDFVAGASVRRLPLLAEAQAGFAVMAWGMRLSYTHVVQTQQFQHQHGGLHQLGSLALSARF